MIYWKGSVRMSAVVPRQNALGFREREGPHRNRELDDGQRLWAPGVGPKALQCHNGIVGYSRWECQQMKPGETAGTGGDERMKRGGDSVSPYKGYLHIRFWTHES